jgi:ATP adenylyltransferase
MCCVERVLDTPRAPNLQLWPRVRAAWNAAQVCGSLQPIETTIEVVESAGALFHVRMASALYRKTQSRIEQGTRNPFLPPYEAELHVGPVPPAHEVLLNKFPVFDHHVLLITRAFEPQDAWLSAEDCQALCTCMAEGDAFAFYNGGEGAGASQPHRHLQLVPVGGRGDFESFSIPLEPIILSGALPFRHVLVKNPPLSADFKGCLDAAMLKLQVTPGVPFNLLMTTRWMLVVPRRMERWGELSVNSLGFAGSLFAKTEEQREAMRQVGPMEVLRAVTFPA